MKTLIALSLLLPVAAFAQAAPKKATPAPKAATPAPAAPSRTAELEPVKVRLDPQPEQRATLAPKIGLFVPTSRMSSAIYVGLEGGWQTDLLDRRLSVVGEVSWTRPRAAGVINDPRLIDGAGGEYTEGDSEVGVMVSAVYRFAEAAAGLTPYLGAGPGVVFHRNTIDAFGSRHTETEARLGLQLLGGAELKLGPGAAFLEARYHFTRVDFVATGNANAGGFVLPALGYRLSL